MHMTPEEFTIRAREMADWIAAYWRRLPELPVLSRVKPGDVLHALPEHPPERGSDDWNAAFADLERIIVPGLTHWQSPGFFAYFPSNISGPAVLGEMLSAGLGVQGMLWATSPACTELEVRVLDWLAEMLGLPESFRSTRSKEGGGGVIQGTASEAVLAALVAARMKARTARPGTHLTLYTSTQAHSSVIKAAMVAGLAEGPDDRTHLRLIGVDEQYRIRPDMLASAVREDREAGRVPCFVCATIGTTSSGAVDPLSDVAEVIGSQTAGDASPRPWLHVDAAHLGAALLCPENRWMSCGVERADSFSFNPHKWMLTNFDCNCFWVRDKRALIDSMSIAPEYLRNAASEAGEVTDFRDWHVPLGRRFRALKLWFVIRHYGVEGLRAYIREHVRLATVFEELVRGDDRFELVAPRSASLVCFRLRDRGEIGEADGRNKSLLAALNESGKVYLTHTVLPRGGKGVYTLRMAIGAVQTREEHVRGAWELVRTFAG